MFRFSAPSSCLPCAAFHKLVAADEPSKQITDRTLTPCATEAKCARFEAEELQSLPTLLTSSRCRDRKRTPWAQGSDVEQFCVQFSSETPADNVLLKRQVERKCTPWHRDPEATKLVQFALICDLPIHDEEIECVDCPNNGDQSPKLETEELHDAEPRQNASPNLAERLLIMTRQSDDGHLETQEDEPLLMTRQDDDGFPIKYGADISIGGLRCRERKVTPWNPLPQCDSDTESTSASIAAELRDTEVDMTLRAFLSEEHAEMLKPDSEDFHRSQIEFQHSQSVQPLFPCCAPSYADTNEMQLSFGGFP